MMQVILHFAEMMLSSDLCSIKKELKLVISVEQASASLS
jgi:hypothetical protein